MLLRFHQSVPLQVDSKGVAKPETVVYAVKPQTGRCLVYWHQTLHAGAPVGEKVTKFTMRTDVMYERNPAACVTPEDHEASTTPCYLLLDQINGDTRSMPTVPYRQEKS